MVQYAPRLMTYVFSCRDSVRAVRARHRVGRDLRRLELPAHLGDDQGRVPGIRTEGLANEDIWVIQGLDYLFLEIMFYVL